MNFPTKSLRIRAYESEEFLRKGNFKKSLEEKGQAELSKCLEVRNEGFRVANYIEEKRSEPCKSRTEKTW